jgi:hypothetical protein
MKIYEIYDEDRNKLVDMAEDIKEMASNIVECLDKAEKREDNPDGEMSFRRSPRMRSGRSRSANYPRMRGGQRSFTDIPPHMRGYVVRPEDEDWAYNERYNW